MATRARAFPAATTPARRARGFRTEVVPRALPPLAGSPAFRRLVFRTISQTSVDYRASPLSEGRAGRVRGGDRLPWIEARGDAAGGAADNFAPLASLDWQVVCFGASPHTKT